MFSLVAKAFAATAVLALASPLAGSPASAASKVPVTFFDAVPAVVMQALAPELPVMQTTVDPVTGATISTTVGYAPVSGLMDIYDGKKLIADNVKPGAFKTVNVSAGEHTFNIYADGYAPGTGKALLSVQEVGLAAGEAPTLALGLNRDATQVSSEFYDNQVSTNPGGGAGWLVVRNIAATGPLDVKVNGKVLFTDLATSTQAVSALPSRDYDIKFMGGSGKTTVLAKDSSVVVHSDQVSVVYVWGSAEAGVVAAAEQAVPLS